MILINLVLALWVWASRALVGTMGWVFFFFPITVGPWLVAALVVTLVLTRRRYPKREWRTVPGRPGSTWLSVPQATAQLVAWVGLAGTGLFLVDGTDAPDSERSVFTALAGGSDTALDATHVLTSMFALVAVLGWAALVGLLLWQGPAATAARRAADEAEQRAAYLAAWP